MFREFLFQFLPKSSQWFYTMTYIHNPQICTANAHSAAIINSLYMYVCVRRQSWPSLKYSYILVIDINFVVFNLENTGDTWFLFPDIMMMSTKLIRNILSIPKLLQASSFSCSRCLDNQVSGSLILYVHPKKLSLKKWSD